jgi:hypothetical protein
VALLKRASQTSETKALLSELLSFIPIHISIQFLFSVFLDLFLKKLLVINLKMEHCGEFYASFNHTLV